MIELLIFLAVPDASFGAGQPARLPEVTGAAQAQQSVGPRRSGFGFALGRNAPARLSIPHLGRRVGGELLAVKHGTSARTQIAAGGSVVAGRTETVLRSTLGWHDILTSVGRHRILYFPWAARLPPAVSSLCSQGISRASRFDYFTGREKALRGTAKPASDARLGCGVGTRKRAGGPTGVRFGSGRFCTSGENLHGEVLPESVSSPWWGRPSSVTNSPCFTASSRVGGAPRWSWSSRQRSSGGTGKATDATGDDDPVGLAADPGSVAATSV